MNTSYEEEDVHEQTPIESASDDRCSHKPSSEHRSMEINVSMNTSNKKEDVHEQTPIESANADCCSHNIKVNSTSSTMSNRKCKISYCYFCHLPQAKIARHLRSQHGIEKEVQHYEAGKDT